MKRLFTLLAALLLSAGAAYADSVVTVRPTATDSVYWSQLGADYAAISNPFSFTTTDGVSGTGSYASAGDGAVYTSGANWGGNFTAGDVLNFNDYEGAITLNFSSGYTQIGAQIQDNYGGVFTAQICDVNGCFTENGVSNAADDDSAIYLGIESGSPIDWATFSLTSGSYGYTNAFAINQVTLDGGAPAATPEPSSLLLLGTGLLGLVSTARRRLAI